MLAQLYYNSPILITGPDGGNSQQCPQAGSTQAGTRRPPCARQCHPVTPPCHDGMVLARRGGQNRPVGEVTDNNIDYDVWRTAQDHFSNIDFELMKAVCSQGSSATPRPHVATQAASSLLRSPGGEIELISNDAMHRVSEIKLIRTDTTLDLSQKAEKV